MSSLTSRRYIENFRNILSEFRPDSGHTSPYTPEAARSQTPEQGSQMAYGASLGLGSLEGIRGMSSRGSLGRSTATIPARVATRSLAERGLADGLATLAPRRRVVVPPALGPAPSGRQEGASVARSHRTPSSPTRLAGARRTGTRSLDQLMQDSFTTDQELEALMVSSLEGGSRSGRSSGIETGPGLRLERSIRPGRGWETHLRDDSALIQSVHQEISALRGRAQRAETLRREALHFGAGSETGRERALEACREYQAYRQGREALLHRAQDLPQGLRARVESGLSESRMSRSDRDMAGLIRRFRLAD